MNCASDISTWLVVYNRLHIDYDLLIWLSPAKKVGKKGFAGDISMGYLIRIHDKPPLRQEQSFRE